MLKVDCNNEVVEVENDVEVQKRSGEKLSVDYFVKLVNVCMVNVHDGHEEEYEVEKANEVEWFERWE